ncbi:MAG: Brp/Blh family beta-carotene 15,15'-dioxygenase [Pseudomonadota bacterium]|nr:Brp/Blh family beta-carotene 15,15'-dioxygenase [Pseudomonadota bacterium]
MYWEYTAIALIILGGLPHGALDPVLAKNARIYTTKYGFIIFICAYSFIGILTTLFWLKLPFIGLSLFILISVYHFSRDQISLMHGIPYATLILALTVWFWPTEVEQIFRGLIFGEDPNYIITVIHFAGYIAVLSLLLEIKNWNSQILFDLLILLCFAVFFPPLIYFSLYFVFIHSARHIKHEFTLLDKGTQYVAVKNMVTYSGLTLLLALLAYGWFSSNEDLTDLHFKILFIGLAAITVPHMLLIELLRMLRVKVTPAKFN